MDKMGYEPNLIQYSTLHADRHERFRWLRPRLVGYGFVLAAMTAGFVWTISHRVPLGLDIIRDRARLYREHWDGSVENVYTVRIMNREQRDRTYALRAEADVPLELKSGRPSDAIVVEAGSQLSLPVRLIAAPGERMDTNTPVEFTVEAEGEPRFRASATSRFLSPAEPGAAAPG
jgi:polyferredoxin